MRKIFAITLLFGGLLFGFSSCDESQDQLFLDVEALETNATGESGGSNEGTKGGD